MKQTIFKFFILGCLALLGLIRVLPLHGQQIVYNDASTLITGIWNVNCTINEIMTQSPFEGNHHYEMVYTGQDYWAGIGLNMNNWGATETIDFSGYNAIRVAYRGLEGNQIMRLSIRDINGFGNTIDIGGATNQYVVSEIPLFELTAGTGLDLNQITEVDISIGNDIPTFSGTVYFDAIELFNTEFGNEGAPASLATWARYSKMDRGVNFANWLEAYWLIPFNTFPEVDKYDRPQVQLLIDQGFNSVRLPVTFETIADENPPYTIPVNSVIWDLIDSCILWAAEMDFTLIITNHHGYSLTDANYNDEINRINAIWNQVITRYGSIDPERYFFEIYNEPFEISTPNLHIVLDSVIQHIRHLGSDHTLIVGGNQYNGIGGLISSTPYADSNIIYTIHSYDPYFFTHQGMSWTSPPYFPALPFPNDPSDSTQLRSTFVSASQWSDLYKVPVMLGEFGVSSSADANSRCNYINTISSALYDYDIPWYYWDAISTTDAFGFIDGSTIEPCFESALRLGDENNCALMVSNKVNEGPGSLRDQLQCASSGDTIQFSNAIAGDTIRLSTLPLLIGKNVYFKNENVGPIYLTSQDNQPILYIANNQNSGLEGVHLIGNDASIVLNNGTLTLKNMDIQPLNGATFNPTTGVYYIEGAVQIK